MGARGLRSSWASVARNSSFRLSASWRNVLGPPPLGHVAKDHHDPDDFSVFVPDGSRAVVDRPLDSIPRDQDGVIGQSDDQPFLQHFFDGTVDRRAGLLIDDPEDCLEQLTRASECFQPVSDSAIEFK